MDIRRVLMTLMVANREEDDDDEEELIMVMNFIRMRKRNRARRSKLLPNLIKLFYGGNRGDNRLAMTGFSELVWRYSDVQFSEDFRMTRGRFEVNISLFRLDVYNVS